MGKVRVGGELVRKFLIYNIDVHPADIVKMASEKFDCSRQAVHQHMNRLVGEGAVLVSGRTRSKRYSLAPLLEWESQYAVTRELAEDTVWRSDVAPLLGKLPDNVLNIWHHGFTEMLNNVIDHSVA